jgi:UDP-N-acetylmuramate dehydrogenase
MDEPWPGAVILMRRLNSKTRTPEGNWILGAGVENSEAAEFFASQKLTGAEWLNRLPGEIGGTVRMNARCYGGEMSGIVTRVTSIDPAGNLKEYDSPTAFKGYKDTIFCHNNEIIVAAEFNLTSGNERLIRNTMITCENDRTQKKQFAHPSCGCVFKNNYDAGVPSGRLMENAGLKGRRRGQAIISESHANFIFNLGGASARDIIELALEARDVVFQQTGIKLDLEMEVRGVLPPDLATRL